MKAEALAAPKGTISAAEKRRRKHGHYQHQTMTKPVSILVIGLLAFAAETPSVADEVTQTTGSGSWCSPAQNGNGNTVIRRDLAARDPVVVNGKP